MDKEQAKQKWIESLEIADTLTKTDTVEQNMNAFDAGWDCARQWISVEDDLPPVNTDNEFDLKNGFSKEVLVRFDPVRNTYAVGYYCHNADCFMVKGSSMRYKITHFQYIN